MVKFNFAMTEQRETGLEREKQWKSKIIILRHALSDPDPQLTRSGLKIPAVGHSEGGDFLVWTRLSSESLDSLYSLVHLIH